MTSFSDVLTTPLRKLIERMPEVAEVVLTKCMTSNDARLESSLFEVIPFFCVQK